MSDVIYTKDVVKFPYVSIGDYTYGTPIIIKDHTYPLKVTIGKFCSIGGNVVIAFWGKHQMNDITTYPFYFFSEKGEWSKVTRTPIDDTGEDVYIGNDVWIATNVLILQGSTIGDGAVLGANCVVAGNIRPYSVVIGNPAKEIRRRFSDEDVDKLLEIKWWDWSKDKLNKHLQLISSNNINDLYNAYLADIRSNTK